MSDCEPAGLPCVGGQVTANRPVFLALADDFAARRLAVAVLQISCLDVSVAATGCD
jgi:hypothetical protein